MIAAGKARALIAAARSQYARRGTVNTGDALDVVDLLENALLLVEEHEAARSLTRIADECREYAEKEAAALRTRVTTLEARIAMLAGNPSGNSRGEPDPNAAYSEALEEVERLRAALAAWRADIEAACTDEGWQYMDRIDETLKGEP